MILLNWLVGLRNCRTLTRKSALPKPAEVRHHIGERVECLEDRCVLSGVSAAYSSADASWFDVASVASTASGSSLSGAGIGSPAAAITERQFLVRLTPEAVEQVHSPQQAQALFANSGAGLHVQRGLGLPGQLLVTTSERDSARVVAAFQNNPNVAHFEEDLSVGATTLFPNEQTQSSLFADQYGLHNVGQNGGSEDADIDAPEAWAITTGSLQVVVSVIDSGVDFTHPDLYRNIWLNNAEIPGSLRAQLADSDGDGSISFRDLNAAANASFVRDLNHTGYIDAGDILDDPLWSDGIDTDRNGFEDDLVGWDFQDNDNRPFDEHGHGTHVAGILGAEGNNASPLAEEFDGGVVGVAWTTTILPLRFLDENNTGDLSDAIEAINYQTLLRTSATSPANIRVSNNSWGVSGSLSQNLFDAVAATGAADILFVAAAGNGDILGRGVDNDQTPFYPANLDLPNVISVGAFGPDGSLASFSNFGDRTVDIAAPGVGIISTAPGGTYITRNGTSMATPFVTGTAALVFSSRPSAGAAEVRDALLQGADSRPELANEVRSGRRLNALGALQAPAFAPVAALTPVNPITAAGGSILNLLVTYTDEEGVDLGTIDPGDLEIARAGFSATRLIPLSTTFNRPPLAEIEPNNSRAEAMNLESAEWTTSVNQNITESTTIPHLSIRGTGDSTFDYYSFQVSQAGARGVFDIDEVTLSGLDAQLFLFGPNGELIAQNDDASTNLGGAGSISGLDSFLDVTLPTSGGYVIAVARYYSTSNGNQVEGNTPLANHSYLLNISVEGHPAVVAGGQTGATEVTYQLSALGGHWDATDSGEYIVRLRASEVADGNGIYNSARELGRFRVQISDGNVFFVNTTVDSVDANLNDGIPADVQGRVSLRAAVMQANARLTSTVIVVPDGVYTLTIPGREEAISQTGDLDINSSAPITILGGGALMTRIDAQRLDRVLDVIGTGPVVLRGVTLQNGNAGFGGGIQNVGTLTLDSVVVANNTANGGGGGISNMGTLNLIGSSVENNQTTSRFFGQGGGGISSHGFAPFNVPRLNVDRSSIINNATSLGGGGISADVSWVTVTNSTISGNSALSGNGGGLRISNTPDGAIASISNSTIVSNSATSGGGGGLATDTDENLIEVSNSIIAENSAKTSHDIEGQVLSNGSNLFGQPSETRNDWRQLREDASDFDQIGTIQQPLDPQLDSLTRRDGLLSVHVPLTGSPVIDNGQSDLMVDQFGQSRGTDADGVTAGSSRTIVAKEYITPTNRLEDAGAAIGSDYLLVTTDSGRLFPGAVNTIDAGGGQTRTIAAGDFDEDGNIDLIVGRNFGGARVLLGNGDRTFRQSEMLPIPFFESVSSSAVRDFNHDGHLDLAVITDEFPFGFGRTQYLLGNGDGTFDVRVQINLLSPQFGERPLIVDDINGDGDADVAVIDVFGRILRIQFGNNTTVFAAEPVNYDLGDGATSFAVGDFDEDGRRDFVLTAVNGTMSLLRGQSDGTLATAISFGAGVAPTAVTVGDFNEDGLDDLLVTSDLNNGNGTLSLLVGNGNGTFQMPIVLATNANAGASVSDVDGDFHSDIVFTSNANNGTMLLLRGNGNGTFQTAISAAAGALPSKVLVANFDQDEDREIIVANQRTLFVLDRRTDGLFDGQITQPPTFTTGNPVTEMVEVDINRDGILDLIGTNTNSGTISVLRGNGDGSFQPPTTFAAGSGPYGLAIADFTGDGLDDVLVANRFSETITLLPGDGNGAFLSSTSFAVGFTVYGLVAADFDGDSKVDVAVTSDFSPGEVAIFKGDGLGSLQKRFTYAAGAASESIVAADFNEDGHLDLAMKSIAKIDVLLGNGDGSFQTVRELSAEAYPANLIATDFNGDLHVDLVFTQQTAGVGLRLGNGDGSFRDEIRIEAGTLPIALRVRDLDHDGHLDLVVSNSDNTVSAVLGNANGTFQASVSFSAGVSSRSLVVNDFNGDGRDDVVAGSDGFGSTASVLLAQDPVTLGRLRNGFVSALHSFPTPPYEFHELDGQLYFFVGGTEGFRREIWSYNPLTSDVSFRRTFFLNSRSDLPREVVVRNGRLEFVTNFGMIVFEPVFNTLALLNGPADIAFQQFELPTESGHRDLFIHDFNGDGQNDLLSKDGLDVNLRLGNGDGTFQAEVSSSAGEFYGRLAVGDLNNDGRLDVVIPSQSSSGEVAVLLGGNNGTFQAPLTVLSGLSPLRVAIGNFDGDTFRDLAVVASQSVTILRGNGDGTFQFASRYTVAGASNSIVVSDLDRNGHDDLIIPQPAAESGNTLTVLFGLGNSEFQAPGFGLAAGARPKKVVVRDINNDLIPDLLVIRHSLDKEDVPTVNVLVGMGNREFEALRSFSAGTRPLDLAVTDFDRDGNVDVIIANQDKSSVHPATVSVLRGNGDGSFEPPESFTFGTARFDAFELAVGDLNGDGYDDFVATSGRSDPFVTTSVGSSLHASINTPWMRQLPQSTVVAGIDLFATSDGRLLKYPGDNTPALVFNISSVETRNRVLLQSDYEIHALAMFQDELVCLVRLNDGSETDELLAINPSTGDARSLLNKSNLTIRATAESRLFADGQTLYLTVEVLGSRAGQELCAYSVLDGFRLVADVFPGPEPSEIQDFVSDGSRVYFTALANRVDHQTGFANARRSLFVHDPATGRTREARAGSDVTSGPAILGTKVLFNSRRSDLAPNYLWELSTNAGASDIGAIEVVNGAISGVAFLDQDGDGRRDDLEPGRAGVVIYEDLNNNGRREATEPFAITREDDPATALDESGSYVFLSVTVGPHRLRESLADGFVQTSPQVIQSTAPTLTELDVIASAAGPEDRLTIPSVVGDNIVFADLTTDTLLLKDGDLPLRELISPLITPQALGSAIHSLGRAHAQDGAAVALTANLENGSTVVFTIDLDQRTNLVAVTGSSRQAIGPDGSVGVDTLIGLEDDSVHGFDALSISGSSVGFVATSENFTRYYLSDGGLNLLAFSNAQVTLEGNDEILVDRVIDQTPLVFLTGADVFRTESSLVAEYGSPSAWTIRTRAGDELLQPTIFYRSVSGVVVDANERSSIADVAVSGLNVALRAANGLIADAVYFSNPQDGLTLVADIGTTIPNGTGGFTGFGSVADNLNSPSVAIDGENMVFIGQGSGGQVGIYASINGQLRRIADRTTDFGTTDFGERTAVDFDLGHQAISGNRIVFHVNFSNGSEANYLATLESDSRANVNVQSGRTVDEVSFGANAVPGSIRGVSFTDANGNRQLDSNEMVNADRTVFIDENFNQSLDQNEIRVVTNSEGVFVFPKLAALTDYTIREELRDGFVQTTPRDLSEATVRLGAAQTLDLLLGSSFGLTGGQAADGRVQGVVFIDTNGNGVRDDGEVGVGELRVFVDEKGENNAEPDRKLNGGERSTVTSDDGSYVLENLRGNRHAVRVEVTTASGLRQARPLGNEFSKETVGLKESPVEVVSGDFDGDGDDDLATSIDATNQVQFFTNDGQGNFTAGAKVTVGITPGSLAVGNFVTGSNRAGIVIGHRTSNSVRVLLPQANGSVSTVELVNPLQTFGTGVFKNLGDGPYVVTTGDFSGDGLDDIAVASANGGGDGAVAIFRSNGASGFIHEQILTLPKSTSNSPSAIVAAKLNGDARVDLAVANVLSNTVTLLINTGVAGAGRFELGASIPIGGNSPLSIQAGDLDGVNDPDDLSLDLVTTNFLSDNVSILRNNGNGTFAAAELKTAGRGPASARIVDLDLDGNLDIAFTNSEATNRFGVLRNRGGGLFQAAELSGLADLSNRTLAFSLAVGQFNDDNGDGAINSADTPDVVVSNRRDQTIGATAGSLTIGKNTIVSGALQVEFTTDLREVNGVDFALQQNSHPPTLDALSDLILDEDAALQTIDLTGITDGGDGSQAVRVRASSGNTTLIPAVEVDYTSGMSGTLSFTPTASENGTSMISVELVNAGFDGQFDTLDDGQAMFSFLVTVRAVNNVPSFSVGANQTVNEDVGAKSLAVWATGISRGATNESGQTLNFIVSNDNSGLFSAQPNLAANGTLTFTPASNAHGLATVTVRLRDNGGTAFGGVDLSPPQTFTITVRPVNDIPTFTKGVNQTVSEVVGSRTVSGWATSISVGAANESAQVLSFDVSNDNENLFREQPAVAADGTLTFTPAENAHGSATVNVLLRDSGDFANGGANQTATQTFTITVTAVNDPPTATPQSVSTNEEVGKSISLAGSDNDPEVSQALTFAIASSPAHGTLTGFNANTGAVTYTPAKDYAGSDSFTFTVRDDASAGGSAITSTAATVSLTVININDAPTLQRPIPDQSAVEGLAFSFTLAADTFLDVDLGDQLTITATGLPAWLSFALADGEWKFHGTPQASDIGSANILVRATDTVGASVSDTFALSVTSLLDLTYIATASSLTASVSGGLVTVTNTKLEVRSNGVLIATPATISPAFVKSLTINGGTGADTINLTGLLRSTYSNLTRIVLNGNAGKDTITGSDFDETISGGSGTTTTDNDLLNGGGGIDRLSETNITAVTVTVSNTQLTGLGTDTLSNFEELFLSGGGTTANTMNATGFSGRVTLVGNGGNDVLTGGSGDDFLDGGDGNDKLTGKLGDDVLNGGAGLDTLFGSGGTNYVLSNTALSGEGTDSLTGMEAASLTGPTAGTASVSIDASLFTGAGPNTLTGGLGNDRIIGGSGKDSIKGGTGVDLLTGGLGNDSFDGGSGIDILIESGNVDFTLTNSSLTGGFGSDSLVGNSMESAQLTGGAGDNRLIASAFTLGAVTLDGGGGNDVLIGGSKNDSLLGGDGRDLVVGGLGIDSLSGHAGDDILIGGTISSTISTAAALNALMAEWTSENSYAVRITKLKTGGGANGTTKLNTAVVVNDSGAADRLNGIEDSDWFFQSANDVLDAIIGETIN